jgi:hypothetical protein
MTCLVVVSMASQTHCLLALHRTKLHNSSARSVQPQESDVPSGVGQQPDRQIIRQGFIERGDEIKQPAEADIYHPADAEQRDAFEQQAPDLFALLFDNMLRVGDELPPATLTPVILFAGVSMAILLEVR